MGDSYFYLRWTEQDINGLEELGIVELLTEVRPDGLVTREIGLDASGGVAHRSPSSSDEYGLFDNSPIAEGSLRTEIPPRQFDELWNSVK